MVSVLKLAFRWREPGWCVQTNSYYPILFISLEATQRYTNHRATVLILLTLLSSCTCRWQQRESQTKHSALVSHSARGLFQAARPHPPAELSGLQRDSDSTWLHTQIDLIHLWLMTIITMTNLTACTDRSHTLIAVINYTYSWWRLLPWPTWLHAQIDLIHL